MSLGLKLYITLFLVMVSGLAMFTVLNITNQRAALLELVQLSALRTTDLIKNSIHYSMLINRKEDIDQIFMNFEPMPGFEVIRIYDKTGKIIFTTKPEEKFTQVPKSSQTCSICHSQTQPLKDLLAGERQWIIPISDETRVLAMINPIENEPECSAAGCHMTPEENAILGILDVRMSLAGVDADLHHNQNQIILMSVLLVITVLLVVGILIWTLFRGPVKELSKGTKAIAMGNLEYTIPIHRNDEIGELASSFNTMVSELRRARGENIQWSKTLQQKVEQKTKELEQIQSYLLHVEKMASLGKLAATVAHELNNPLAGILTYTRLTQKRLKEKDISSDLLASINEDLSMVSEETMRCGNIVDNLLLFSKKQIGKYTTQDIRWILNNCIQLIQHHLELNEIELITLLPKTTIKIPCDRDHMQQAILAILMNAVEAMPDGGILTIEARDDDDDVTIIIKDSGPGISLEHLPHIFEPFYSGKKEGKGVGLGLSVAYGIINTYEGKIDIDTSIGHGTTFNIILPKRMVKPPNSNELSTEANDSEGDNYGN